MRRILLLTLAFFASTSLVAKAETIDFSTYAYGPLASADGVTFTLTQGGCCTDGTPAVGSFGTPSLGNSPTGDYPTSEFLTFTFSAPTSGDSMYFNNFGNNDDYGFPSTFTAYAGSTVVSSGDIGGDDYAEGGLLNIAGSGITSIVLDNGFGSAVADWEFGVNSLTFNGSSATPEPSSLVLLGTGILGMAGAARRRLGK